MSHGSEMVRRELSRTVETVVRPLRTSLSRKKRMREEMLGHLGEIYAEEFAKLGDEAAAVTRTRQRFGKPTEVSAEIQKLLSLWDRYQWLVEKVGWKPGESIPHFIGKQMLFSSVWIVMMGLTAVVRIVRRPPGRSAEVWLSVSIVGVTAVVMLVFAVVFMVSIAEFSRALYGSALQRSRFRASVWGAVAFLTFPAITLALWWGILGEFHPPLVVIVVSGCAAPLTLLAYLGMARKVAEFNRYEEEWAAVEVVCEGEGN